MKRFAVKMLAAVMLMAVSAIGLAQDNQNEKIAAAVQMLCGENVQVLSSSACGSRGAAVVRETDGYSLYVLSEENGQWKTVFRNPHAAMENSSVYLDTDELLILSWQEGSMFKQYYFRWKDAWTLSSVIDYDTMPDEYDGLTEYLTDWTADAIRSEICYTDREGNVLNTRKTAELPNVLSREACLLENFDASQPPFTGSGYLPDDLQGESDILKKVFEWVAPPDCTYVDGLLEGAKLQFIADKADGTRVLLCGWFDGSEGWGLTESTPLPAGTEIGIENFVDTLNLGLKGYGVSIGKRADGKWGAVGALDEDYFALGSCWVSDGTLWWNADPAIGTTPWNDITCMDWESLPRSMDEAKAMLDPSGWATPNNPDPKDRLHLRERPDKNSRSLGKYYNGTPLRVIAQEGDFTKVRIGNQVGYMMTKYLLFGEAINRQETALRGKISVNPVTQILWYGEAEEEDIMSDEVNGLLIVGVVEDRWYWVWDPHKNRFGRILQSELWDGNG